MSSIDTVTAVPAAASRSARATGRAGQRKPTGHRGFPYLLVLPAVVLLALFVAAPGIYALILSLQTRRVSGGLLGTSSETVFAGADNYRAALSDGTLWSSLVHMVAMAAITIPLTIGIALLFALCLDSIRARLTRFTRLSIFLPYAVPGVIATLLWGFLYLPATSPIGGNHVNFFGQVAVFFSVGNVVVWGAVGFNMVVMFTALRALPSDIYDAARIDGCSELRIALHVKIPLLRPALLMCALFTALAALQIYNEPNTLRPLANAISTTWVPLMKIYTEAFVDSDVNLAAATSVLYALAVLIISVVASRLVARRSAGWSA
ncbi:MAG TPA: sugar ABC transporter permease [Pseudonocardiaceae bacterium]|jgi:multiple sugar transport system permease protein|nr:sugar ABC transporter permease [Pseudonocardiaceae bacterium]